MQSERRLEQPRWLSVAVPLGSLVVAAAVMAAVLAATSHDPWHTYRRLFAAAFTAHGALSGTFTFATPLLFTGLAAAAAFRMNLFNIGGEGQFYLGAIGGIGAALWVGGSSQPASIVVAIVGGAAAGAVWALIPGVLRAFGRTNEIITSLMLNYVAGRLLEYLIYTSHSFWRDTTSPQAQVFPLGKTLPGSAHWPLYGTGVTVPFGLLLGVVAAAFLWMLYSRTRFGFEVDVIGDSPRAARYAGMRTRRKILSVLAVSGGIAGIGGAAQIGNFDYAIDPRGLQSANYGYTGIVVAALARYNPFAVCLIAVLLGGLQNAGYTLQGADFPSGLVGVMQGIILFCALGGELLIRYRVRIPRWSRGSRPELPSAAEAQS
jgi:general nucleoside transport system permease protein